MTYKKLKTMIKIKYSVSIILSLFAIIHWILSSNKDKELLTNFNFSENDQGPRKYDSHGTFEKIMNCLVYNLENSSEIFEKITELITDDFKPNPQKVI